MFVGSCLEEYVIALLTFVAGYGIGKDDFVGVADMGFAGCVGDGGGDVVCEYIKTIYQYLACAILRARLCHRDGTAMP